MPRKLRPDDTVQGWRILHEIHVGPLAMSYASLSPGGGKAFLKLYKSPTRSVPWYKGFMIHQISLNVRIEAGPARAFTVRRLDGFEAEFGAAAVAYFQAFEFVEGGEDLENVISQIRTGHTAVGWPQRVLMAKVLMAGVQALHDSGVVHGDLKPANVQVFRDASIHSGYRLKLIDLDYAVMPDMASPWHGYQGYVGTPGYYSPEHLIGQAPVPASDVFTCGLMLHELLTDYGNPYRLLSDEDYRRACGEWKAPKPRLAGSVKDVPDSEVVAVIHQCLHPDPARRPTAGEVLAVLNAQHKLALEVRSPGRPARAKQAAAEPAVPARSRKSPTSEPKDKPVKVAKSQAGVAGSVAKPAKPRAKSIAVAPPSPLVRPEPPAPIAPPTPLPIPRTAAVSPAPPVAAVRREMPPSTGTKAGILYLVNASDRSRRLAFRLRTPVGRHLLQSITEPGKFANEVQYWIEPRADGNWWVQPEPGTTNQTLLNGRAVTTEMPLIPGNRLSVGNEATGAEKQTVVVEIEPSSRGVAP